MKCKTILVTTLLLGFSDLMGQNQIGKIPKPDAIGIYCVGYGLYRDIGEREKLVLTEDEKKINQAIVFLLGDLRQVCIAVAANMLPADDRKKVSDELTKTGYRTELVSEVFPTCKQWEWTKTRCVDTYKSLYDKKAKFLEEHYDEADAESKKLDKKLGY